MNNQRRVRILRRVSLALALGFVACGSSGGGQQPGLGTGGAPGSGGKGGATASGGSGPGGNGGVRGTGGTGAAGGTSAGGRGLGGDSSDRGGGGAGATAGGGRGGGGGGGGGGIGGSASAGMGGGGRGGAGHGGAGGSSACQQAAATDRSCATSADCAVVTHQTNCCGAATWIGVRASEAQAFAKLEMACDASYPACGCASGSPTTDDGSSVPRGPAPAVSVSCQAGTCKTFATACGQPCEAGRSCITCGADARTSVCSLRCSGDTACTEAPYSKCEASFGNGTCTAPNLSCTSQL